MSYYHNDPAYIDNACTACGEQTYHADDELCEDCRSEGEDEIKDASTPEAQREIGREAFAAGLSIDDCRGHWQMIGWEEAAEAAGHPDYVAA